MGNEQLFIFQLRDSAIGEALMAAKLTANFAEVMGSEIIVHDCISVSKRCLSARIIDVFEGSADCQASVLAARGPTC